MASLVSGLVSANSTSATTSIPTDLITSNTLPTGTSTPAPAPAPSTTSTLPSISISTTDNNQSSTALAVVSSSSFRSTRSTTTSSPTSQHPEKAASTTASQRSTTSSSTHTSAIKSSNRLANGTVAGIVVAVALGLALLTFLATFFLMRRRQQSQGKRRYRSSRDNAGLEMRTPRKQGQASALEKPFVAEASSPSGTYENYLPQSADDSTVQQKTKALLDQIELHVENFYRNSSSSAPQLDNAELAAFNSPYLPASLASLLPRSKNRSDIIKHALAHLVASSISPSASPAQSLLPSEYALLPNTVTNAKSGASTKAGSAQIMSRWRVMTAYLRPDPTKDAAYIAQRSKQISDTTHSFAWAFAPWKNLGYKDEERTRSLSAILEDAANLGIFLFSQPSTLKFHWPTSSEVGPGRIVISPALVKTTNEKGQELVEAQVMVNKVVRDA